jgi:ribosomal protein S18 acetylase RimI-like enzyme
MKVSLIPIDTQVLGGAVLSVDEFDAGADFAAFENAYVRDHNPVYVSCKLSMDRIADAHGLEAAGFRLIECQIRSAINLNARVELPSLPYLFERITREEDLAPVLDIAARSFTHDRFSMDPLVPRGLSGERYRRYLRQSFESSTDAVFRLYDPASGVPVAFKSHRHLPGGEALLLLGGVDPQHQRLGLGALNTLAEIDELKKRGVRRGITHISAANHQVFNLEFGKLGFKALETFAVLRKVYRAIRVPETA